MSKMDGGSLWYVPTANTDGFPKADHTSTAVLADSVFATTKRVLLDGFEITTGSAAGHTITVKNTAGATLFTRVYGTATTNLAVRGYQFGPNGLEIDSGFSLNTGAADALCLVWYRIG